MTVNTRSTPPRINSVVPTHGCGVSPIGSTASWRCAVAPREGNSRPRHCKWVAENSKSTTWPDPVATYGSKSRMPRASHWPISRQPTATHCKVMKSPDWSPGTPMATVHFPPSRYVFGSRSKTPISTHFDSCLEPSDLDVCFAVAIRSQRTLTRLHRSVVAANMLS